MFHPVMRTTIPISVTVIVAPDTLVKLLDIVNEVVCPLCDTELTETAPYSICPELVPVRYLGHEIIE